MDTGDQWMLEYLQGFVSESTLAFLHEHVLHPHAPFQVFKRHAVMSIQKGINIMYPFLEPFIDRAVVALHNSPDVVVLAFILVLLYLTFQILNTVRRATMWAAGLAVKMMFYALIVAVLAMVWQRGFEASARDAMALCTKVAGAVATAKEFWWQSYKQYQAQTQSAARGGRVAASRGRAGPR
ncbi:hypothetical protein NKR23_g10425 [Pleurostoma richardsiae]|uniref:Uncharacterized protein n=1 Tax=Pleurostoma richardsiae TaxID=41990 RepID=A0AA38RMG9_9PEZI|nr:hypothetical protein NKR23_g10425 [Pleurostoma richardsiae]